MQDGRTAGAAGEAASSSYALCLLLWNRRNRGRTVRRFTRHAADELYRRDIGGAPKNIGFLPAQPGFCCRASLLDRDDDEGQQTTGGTPRTVKMAQERDDLVYLAKLAEQAERFDEMARRRRGGSITPFVYLS